ncbi:MAG: biotin--[acetyl-CoA-carboxylase] ligase [Thermoleophilaceae bacterium]|nr:biotin--[acetyl-CoA-carboxylase] ligase [Thermoleophilaceae bacterium]
MSATSGGFLGRPHLHHRLCDSTNTLAKELANAGAVHGTTVTASEQTGGRGRQGRAWVAPAGSALLMSVIVRPLQPQHQLAPLAAGLAVAETCEALTGVSCTIKWPNDVWIEQRKVAGILVEAKADQTAEKSWAVIGIGLNTSVDLAAMPEELRTTATTLGLPAETNALPTLISRLEFWTQRSPRDVIAAWRQRDALLGRQISWSAGSGTAAGVDDNGNLLVQSADGQVQALNAGEVHLSVEL